MGDTVVTRQCPGHIAGFSSPSVSQVKGWSSGSLTSCCACVSSVNLIQFCDIIDGHKLTLVSLYFLVFGKW